MRFWRGFVRWALAPFVGLVLVSFSAVPEVSADFGTITLPSASALAECTAATDGICGVALAVGAVLVVAGWDIVDPTSFHAAVNDAWNALTGAQQQAIYTGVQANQQVVGLSMDEVNAMNNAVAAAANQYGWTQNTAVTGGADTGTYLEDTATSGQGTLQEVVSFAISSSYLPASGGISIHIWPSPGQGTQPAFREVTNDAVTATSAGYSWSCSGLISCSGSSTAGGTTAGEIASATTSSTGNVSVVLTYAGALGATLAAGDASTNALEIDINQLGSPYNTYTYYAYPDAGTSAFATTTLTGYSAPATRTSTLTVPSVVNIPHQESCLINATPSTTCVDMNGQTAAINPDTASGQVGLLQGILNGITDLPNQIADTFVPTAAMETALEGRWTSIANGFGGVVPFSYIVDIDNALTNYFSSAGTQAMDYQFPWSYTPSGGTAESYTWNVNLQDLYTVLPTIRIFMNFVLYGLLFLFGFTEARKWFGSGGAE